MARITVVSAGHMAHCPRMVKAADAFQRAGHQVRVVSTLSMPWGIAADRRLQASRGWRWTTVDYSRERAPVRWLTSGIRRHAACAAARRRADRTPLRTAARVLSRVSDQLVTAILREPSDLVYGGSVGSIAPVLEASHRSGVPCAIDFEDYHCDEHAPDGDGVLLNGLAARVMDEACRHAALLTAGSGAIARAVERRYGRPVLPIDNVFSLAAAPSFERRPGPLRLYWFSQTIGPARGLEDVVDAAARASMPCELHLRGVPLNGYVDTLRRRASDAASGASIVVHAPASPDDMVAGCSGFDAGVSAEQGHVANRALNLPNKALTYPLAGLALVLTRTEGQQPLAASLGDACVVYSPGDIDSLADGLTRLASTGTGLRHAREAAWEAARTRWHWEHALERDALLAAVEGVLQ